MLSMANPRKLHDIGSSTASIAFARTVRADSWRMADMNDSTALSTALECTTK